MEARKVIESADEFYRLRTSDDIVEYQRAADEEAPLAVWEEIIARYPEMKFWVAQNKTVPIVILETLAADADVRVRSMVASKRKLPEQLQLQLARDPSESVRESLAYNAQATQRTLQLLANDLVPRIREKVRSRV